MNQQIKAESMLVRSVSLDDGSSALSDRGFTLSGSGDTSSSDGEQCGRLKDDGCARRGLTSSSKSNQKL